MTKEELQALIKATVGTSVADAVREAQERAAEAAANQPTPEAGPEPVKEFDKTTRIARAIRYLAEAGNNKNAARDIAHKIGDADVVKALGAGSAGAGAELVDGDFASDIIPVLRSASVVRSLGPRIAPMNGGSLTMPYGDTGASAGYIGENSTIAKTEPTTGQLVFTAKKLAAVVPTSNELLRDTSGRADVFIRDDLANAMADAENVEFLRGQAGGAGPKGITKLATDALNSIAANAVINIANVTTDLGQLILAVQEGDVTIRKGGWVFAPRTAHYLMTARDGSGNLVWAPEMATGKLMGYDFKVTTAIPVNLGAGTDESEVLFADYDSLVIAESDSLQLDVFEGGAYHDGVNVVSGISNDQTVVRAIARHDFNGRFRGKETAILTAVKW